jgi:hypothetical protein
MTPAGGRRAAGSVGHELNGGFGTASNVRPAARRRPQARWWRSWRQPGQQRTFPVTFTFAVSKAGEVVRGVRANVALLVQNSHSGCYSTATTVGFAFQHDS